MEASEMRVGNFVLNVMNQIITVDWGQIKYAKDFKPIPLSEVWLIKFRFKGVPHKKGVQAAYKKGSVRINISNSGNCYYKNKYVYYVHKLQNLYYELENKELTLKENE